MEEMRLMQIKTQLEYNLSTNGVCCGLHTHALRWLEASPVHRVGLGTLDLGLGEKLSLGSASVGS